MTVHSSSRGRPEPGPVHRLRGAEPGAPTVFAVHPGALPVRVYRTLAAALPAGHGLTVLDLGGVAEYWQPALTGGPVATSVAALAGRLLAALEAEQPHARPTLVGWSFGGVAAHAMVLAMPPERRPARLVLLDSIAPIDAYQRADDELDHVLLLDWFCMYLGAKRGRAVRCPVDRLARATPDDALAAVLEAAVAAGALPADVSLPGLRKLYDTYVEGLLRNNRLTATHRPPPSPVPLVLVKAARSLLPGDRELGWTHLAGDGLTVLPCPGDHYTMLTRADAASAIVHSLHPTAPAPAATRPSPPPPTPPPPTPFARPAPSLPPPSGAPADLGPA